MTITIQDGEFEATLNVDEFRRSLQRAEMRGVRSITDDIRVRTERIYRIAHQAWPVGERRPGDSRPHSRDMLRREIVVNAAQGRIAGLVTSPASYTRFIQSGKAREAAYTLRPDGFRPGSRAARSGSVIWTLLRWPEKWHAKDFIRTSGREVERLMAQELR